MSNNRKISSEEAVSDFWGSSFWLLRKQFLTSEEAISDILRFVEEVERKW